MKSKNYILSQIKEILLDRKDHTDEQAEAWLDEHRGKTVYELLVLKKQLNTVEREFIDVSFRGTLWPEEEY